jgi:hypothetical protein
VKKRSEKEIIRHSTNRCVKAVSRMSHEQKKKMNIFKFGQQRTTEQKFNAPNSACLEITNCVFSSGV